MLWLVSRCSDVSIAGGGIGLSRAYIHVADLFDPLVDPRPRCRRACEHCGYLVPRRCGVLAVLYLDQLLWCFLLLSGVCHFFKVQSVDLDLSHLVVLPSIVFDGEMVCG